MLSSFSPSTFPGGPPVEKNALSQFNSQSGSWAIYLFMSVIAELLVVLIYIFFGMRLPIEKDYKVGRSLDGAFDSDVELSRGDPNKPYSY